MTFQGWMIWHRCLWHLLSTPCQLRELLSSLVTCRDAPASHHCLGSPNLDLIQCSRMAGTSPEHSETSDSSERQKHLRSNSWHKRLGSTSSVMQKNWDAFKNRNPNTMQQVNPPSMQYAFISQVACVYFSSRMRLILN